MNKMGPVYFAVPNMEKNERYVAALTDFRKSCRTEPIFDELRTGEYRRLDVEGQIYLDYTGGGLYADSQIRDHTELLLRKVLGNPHSSNPTSSESTTLIQSARARILEFFNASAADYDVIFTQNASGALKLVGESYPFQPGSDYLLFFDNHNSVNGIREFARQKGANVTYAPMLPPDLLVDEARLKSQLSSRQEGADSLFAYPAQSNFSGVQHSLQWIERAHTHGWDVLLDAAAFVPTNRLDLGKWQPDYVPISFYKMFGYPTGVGCLLARRAALPKLRRPWFSGGTITVASVQPDHFYLQQGGEAFEDGTLNYLALPAIEIGLSYIERIGIEYIHEHVMCLTGWLLHQLAALRHRSGSMLAKIYGPVGTESRGGTVTFNFYDADGHFIDHRIVEKRANEEHISLRTGCFCNPGGGELALGLSSEELSSCFSRMPERLTIDEFRQCIDDKSTGAVRISLGIASNFDDVYRFVEFARTFLG